MDILKALDALKADLAKSRVVKGVPNFRPLVETPAQLRKIALLEDAHSECAPRLDAVSAAWRADLESRVRAWEECASKQQKDACGEKQEAAVRFLFNLAQQAKARVRSCALQVLAAMTLRVIIPTRPPRLSVVTSRSEDLTSLSIIPLVI